MHYALSAKLKSTAASERAAFANLTQRMERMQSEAAQRALEYAEAAHRALESGLRQLHTSQCSELAAVSQSGGVQRGRKRREAEGTTVNAGKAQAGQ